MIALYFLMILRQRLGPKRQVPKGRPPKRRVKNESKHRPNNQADNHPSHSMYLIFDNRRLCRHRRDDNLINGFSRSKNTRSHGTHRAIHDLRNILITHTIKLS